MFLRKNNIKYLLTALVFYFVFFLQSCADPENDDKSDDNDNNSTLNSQSVGDGSSGSIDDYFYDFDDAIDASFFRYGKSRFNTSYDKYITSYPYPPDNLNMKNFPDYLLDVTPDSAQFVVRHPIDTLIIGMDTVTSDIGRIVQDSLRLSSSQFKNLESIE